MLSKNIAHLNTSKACPKLGNSDLVQLPHITGKQREAESRTVTWPAVEMGLTLHPRILPTLRGTGMPNLSTCL